MSIEAEPEFAEYVSHEEFRAGLPRGRFRVIVDPKLAPAYVRQRLWLLPLVLATIGAGLVLALSGATWPGGLLVFAAVAVNRAVTWGAGRILLHLASQDPSVYAFATGNGIMEVRRA